MKGYIKRLLREELLREFNESDFTPEEIAKIKKSSQEQYYFLVKNAKERFEVAKSNYESVNLDDAIDRVMNSDKFADSEKEGVIISIKTIVSGYEKEYNESKAYYERLVSDKEAVIKNIYDRQYMSADGEAYRIYMNKEEGLMVNKELSKEDIINMFVTALEGGSNYWYVIKHVPDKIKYAISYAGSSSSMAIINYIMDGGKIYFYDSEEVSDEEDNDEDAYLGYVDIDKLLDAISIIKRDYPDVYKNIIMETYDANDADVFLQICVMGEVVYG